MTNELLAEVSLLRDKVKEYEEAWEKAKEKVEDKIDNLEDELKNGEVCLSYYYGKMAGLSEVLVEIIDKHLEEAAQ